MKEGVVASAKLDNVRVDLEYIGEGLNGDYDENDPNDEPLLRFTIYMDDEQVENASYCTQLRADTDELRAQEVAGSIIQRVYLPLISGCPIKKLCEALSWISE